MTESEQVTVYAGDCLDVLAELGDASVDSVVTDPPYGLGFMSKAWDSPGDIAALRPRADGDYATTPFKRSKAEYGGASYGGNHAVEMHAADGLSHPTVKPLDLMRWLIRLVTPPHGIVLDPFAGTGTTGEAAIHEHMHAILIEREPTYIALINARLGKPIQTGFDW